MEKLLDVISKNRRILHALLHKTPKTDLYKIPKGFRNNIWWNIAHVVVTSQLLIYRLSGLDLLVEKELVNKYRKGTVPEGEPTEEEIEKISNYLTSTVEQLKLDYEGGKFKNFKEYMTSPGVALHCIEDAITFSVFHEGLHLGTISALKKAIAQEG